MNFGESITVDPVKHLTDGQERDFIAVRNPAGTVIGFGFNYTGPQGDKKNYYAVEIGVLEGGTAVPATKTEKSTDGL